MKILEDDKVEKWPEPFDHQSWSFELEIEIFNETLKLLQMIYSNSQVRVKWFIVTDLPIKMITLNLIVQKIISLLIIGSQQTTKTKEKLLVCIVMSGRGGRVILRIQLTSRDGIGMK